MSENRGGDQLARGAASAAFKGPKVTQDAWNEAFGVDEAFEERMRRKALAEGLTEEQYEEAKQEAVQVVQQQQAEQLAKLQEQQKNIRIRALYDRIIVRRAESEDKTDAGLFLADESKEKPSEGIVVSVGPGKFEYGQFITPSVKEGERVVFGKYAGAEVRIGIETLLVLREEDLFLVKEVIQREE